MIRDTIESQKHDERNRRMAEYMRKKRAEEKMELEDYADLEFVS